MFGRILYKSISKRKSRVAMAIVAVVMGASIASALLSISIDIEGKIATELRNFGPNLVVSPKTDTITLSVGGMDLGSVEESEQAYIEEADLDTIAEIEYSENVRGILGMAPYLFGVVAVKDTDVVVAGTWFDQVMAINTWWSVRGEWIYERSDSNSAMIGESFAEKLGYSIGDDLEAVYTYSLRGEDGNYTIQSQEATYKIVGIISAGSDDDERLFINLDAAQNLTMRIDKVNMVQISAVCNACPTDEIAADIEEIIPIVEAKTVKQTAKAEMQLLGKIEVMMMLIATVSLLASAMGVMTTMTTSVIERKKEIGMMKAVGAENNKIAALFLTEATIIGAIGGLIGLVIGYFLAQIIGQSTFQSAIQMHWSVIPITLLLSIGIAVLASSIPVSRALKIEPAQVLREI